MEATTCFLPLSDMFFWYDTPPTCIFNLVFSDLLRSDIRTPLLFHSYALFPHPSSIASLSKIVPKNHHGRDVYSIRWADWFHASTCWKRGDSPSPSTVLDCLLFDYSSSASAERSMAMSRVHWCDTLRFRSEDYQHHRIIARLAVFAGSVPFYTTRDTTI